MLSCLVAFLLIEFPLKIVVYMRIDRVRENTSNTIVDRHIVAQMCVRFSSLGRFPVSLAFQFVRYTASVVVWDFLRELEEILFATVKSFVKIGWNWRFKEKLSEKLNNLGIKKIIWVKKIKKLAENDEKFR